MLFYPHSTDEETKAHREVSQLAHSHLRNARNWTQNSVTESSCPASLIQFSYLNFSICSISLISHPHFLPHPTTQFHPKQRAKLILTQSYLLPSLEFFQIRCPLSPLIYSCDKYLLNIYHMLRTASWWDSSDFVPGNSLTLAKAWFSKTVTWLYLLVGCIVFYKSYGIFLNTNIFQKFRLKPAWVDGWEKDCKNKICLPFHALLVLLQILSATWFFKITLN